MENKQYKKHKKDIELFDGTLEELVERIGDLHYEALGKFLGLLSDKLYKDSCNDDTKKRKKLARCLFNASDQINDSRVHINRALKISKLYMNQQTH